MRFEIRYFFLEIRLSPKGLTQSQDWGSLGDFIIGAFVAGDFVMGDFVVDSSVG